MSAQLSPEQHYQKALEALEQAESGNATGAAMQGWALVARAHIEAAALRLQIEAAARQTIPRVAVHR